MYLVREVLENRHYPACAFPLLEGQETIASRVSATDLQVVRSTRSKDPGGRLPISGRLLRRHPGLDESEIQLLPVVQRGLPEQVRPGLGTHRQLPDDPRRLQVGGLLRHDRRRHQGTLRHGSRELPGRQPVHAAAAAAVPHDGGKPRTARRQPHAPFWRNVKEGTDIFDRTLQLPAVDVCEKRYVFNRTGAALLDPNGTCHVAPLSTMAAL